jgi:hypothetical protein
MAGKIVSSVGDLEFRRPGEDSGPIRANEVIY